MSEQQASPADCQARLEDTLQPLAYQRLRELAHRALSGEHGPQTLNTTALVHEAWLSLADRTDEFRDQTHFFSYAAIAMRHILVDHARHRQALKRGSGEAPLDLDAVELPADHAAAEVLLLNDALDRLELLEPRLARVVELRFFAGLSVEETAGVLGIVARSVVRDWARARVFLQQAMQ